MQVEVEAEVYKGAPQLRLEVMTNCLAHLMQNFSGILLEQLQGAQDTFTLRGPALETL